MKFNFQLKNSSLLKKNKFNRSDIMLNGIIVILIFLISFMSFSLILKLQNLNSYSNLENSQKNLLKPVQVEVLNSCGIVGAAGKVTNILRDKKIDVVQIGNYRIFGVDSSIVIDESIVIDRRGNIKIAENVADSLGIDRKNVIQQINKKYLLDASIIVGKDYKKLILKN